MGITERKGRERQELKQTILDTALEVFVAEGYEKASIRAIAEKIEYSPATIYLYFKDKDELFYAVHELGFGKMFGMMQPLASIENPLDRLREMGRLYLRFAIENPELYDLMFISKAPMNALFRFAQTDYAPPATPSEWPCGQQNFELLRAIVSDCIDQELIRMKDIETAAMAFWSLVHGLASLYIHQRFEPFKGRTPIPVEELMEQTMELFLVMARRIKS